MDGKRLFDLSELNEVFWEKVILITIWHSSSMGGPGSIWIVTEDIKSYFIGMNALPFSEYQLHELTPILKRKENIEDYAHPFEAEENGWKYIREEGTLIRDDFYSDFKTVYDNKNLRKALGWKQDHMPLLAGIALGLSDEPPRYNERNTYLKWKAFDEHMKRLDKKKKGLEIDDDSFVWKPMFMNNTPGSMQFGEYALLFKEYEGKVVGYKFSVVYQREEHSPLCGLINAPIERYNLYEERYDDVFGPLMVAGNDRKLDNEVHFDWNNTLHDYTVNSPGNFIRSFGTLDEAKSYAIAVTRVRSYVTKENIIMDLDNEERIYKNYLRKYEGIMFFRQHYEEILKVVCDCEMPFRNSGRGFFIADAIKEKLNIEDDVLREIWQYIPHVLDKCEQEKAAKICAMCSDILKKG